MTPRHPTRRSRSFSGCELRRFARRKCTARARSSSTDAMPRASRGRSRCARRDDAGVRRRSRRRRLRSDLARGFEERCGRRRARGLARARRGRDRSRARRARVRSRGDRSVHRACRFEIGEDVAAKLRRTSSETSGICAPPRARASSRNTCGMQTSTTSPAARNATRRSSIRIAATARPRVVSSP